MFKNCDKDDIIEHVATAHEYDIYWKEWIIRLYRTRSITNRPTIQ